MSGALLLNIDGEDIAVCASGSDIVAEVRRPRVLLRQAGSFWRGRRLLKTLATGLRDNGLTLTITRDGVPLAKIGALARTSIAGRLLGIAHVALVAGKRKR